MTRRSVAWSLVFVAGIAIAARAQDAARPSPPTLEDFETDADGDGVPDGWYNLRDAKIVDRGGPVGPKYLRFDNARPGRQARASRAFAVDGRETEALIVGLWVKLAGVHTGERMGEDAALQVDFLGQNLLTTNRGVLGPWTAAIGHGWTRVARRIPVSPGTRDAILTLGLLGAIGSLEVDGLTIDKVPLGGAETTNLLLNGDFELGSPRPPFWILEDGARRVFPGVRSPSALEISGSGAKALNGLGVRAERFRELDVRLMVKGTGLRSAGARAVMFFLDIDGRALPGADDGAVLFRWSGTFDWRSDHTTVRVPSAAVRAVLQIETMNSAANLKVDDVEVYAAPDAGTGKWTPYHVETDTDGWRPLDGAPGIAAKSPLDASAFLEAPAGKRGPVAVKEGHLHFGDGSRARFFGVVLLPPLAFPDRETADGLADRLSRSGVNLVRFSAMDAPLGPGRSLYDDSLDDTLSLDPDALARFDHLFAALKARGIYVALELLSVRRFREGDAVPGWIGLPAGGGSAAGFDPTIRALAVKAAESLLAHVNPETRLPLRDDPALAWVTIAGELSVFDRIDAAEPLPPESEALFKDLLKRTTAGSGRRTWQAIESAQWKAIAEDLKKFGLKRPIAGSSHWRRETEFAAAQAAPGLDLIDDRLFWAPPRFGSAEHRSMLWKAAAGLSAESARKRKGDRPYVVGEWAAHTDGAWALPFEGADLMLASRVASTDDWDAIVRRGVFAYPRVWGSASPGTTGDQDLFLAPEAVNANPQVFALLPHAAALFYHANKSKKVGQTAWDTVHGRLLLDAPFTKGVAGWPGRKPFNFESIAIEADNPYAVVMVSSLGAVPIAEAKRLLVTAVSRAEPSGLLYVDQWKREVASPGRPPILVEPVRARVTWKKHGIVKAFALKPDGSRGPAARVTRAADGTTLEIEGDSSTLHWELTE